MNHQSTFIKVMQSVFLILAVYTFLPSQSLHAQGEVSLGTNTVTSYLWRGIQLDNAVNIQPYMMYHTTNFEVGASSSMSLTNDFNEIYFWAAYSVKTPIINAKFYIADFYYEYDGSSFFNFKTDRRDGVQGDHYLEGYVVLTSENNPFKLLFSSTLWNDPDTSLYTEVSYSKGLPNDINTTFSLGASLNESTSWYNTNRASIVNVSYELSKNIPITNEFTLPISVSSILNPTAKAFYVILGVSI